MIYINNKCICYHQHKINRVILIYSVVLNRLHDIKFKYEMIYINSIAYSKPYLVNLDD